MAEKVSEVPNSKYHSLFFVLKETRQQELQRDREKRKQRSVFPPTSKSEACTVIAPLLLFSCLVYSLIYDEEKER